MMAGRKKMICCLGAVVAGLLILAAILLLTEPQDKEEGSAKGQTAALTALDAEQILEIEIINQDGSYHITGGAENGFLVSELQEYVQNSGTLEAAVRSFSQMSGEVVTDGGFEREKYGLSDPAATVKIRTADTETVISLGDYNEGASVWYAEKETDDRLYSISKAAGERILRSGYYYLDTLLIAEFDSDTEVMTERLTSVCIERPDLEEPLEIVVDEEPAGNYTSAYRLTSPIQVKTSLKVMNNQLGGLFGLRADAVLGAYEEQDAKEYGLDEPAMVMTVAHDGIEERFTVGDQTSDGGRYLISSERALLYEISESSLSFLTATADDLFFEMALLPEIDEVESVVLELDGQAYVFALEHKTAEEEETLTVVLEGQELEEKLFRTFYSFLLEIDIEKIRTEEPSGEKILSISYRYTDGTEDVVEAFSLEDSRRMSISVNGEPQFEGRAAYLEKVRTELRHLLNGEAVDTNW